MRLNVHLSLSSALTLVVGVVASLLAGLNPPSSHPLWVLSIYLFPLIVLVSNHLQIWSRSLIDTFSATAKQDSVTKGAVAGLIAHGDRKQPEKFQAITHNKISLSGLAKHLHIMHTVLIKVKSQRPHEHGIALE